MSTIRTVQLDGLALLKVLVHSHDSGVNESVTGQLVGLDVGDCVEVTNTFPFPAAAQTDTDEYQLEMLKSLRSVNVDHNTIGWYTTGAFGSFYSGSTIEHQLAYQQYIPNSVFLVYDPSSSTKGRLQIKAFRLSDAFSAAAEPLLSANASLSSVVSSVCGSVEWSEILEELDIKVHNSHLVHGFLYELRESTQFTCDSERLSLYPWSSTYLHRSMHLLTDQVDDYMTEAGRLAYYQRQLYRQKISQQNYIALQNAESAQRLAAGKEPIEEDRSKNPLFKALPRPSRTAALAIANQIAYTAQQIQTTANQSIHKLYLTNALHKE